jgi:hypothetical protein
MIGNQCISEKPGHEKSGDNNYEFLAFAFKILEATTSSKDIVGVPFPVTFHILW